MIPRGWTTLGNAKLLTTDGSAEEACRSEEVDDETREMDTDA